MHCPFRNETVPLWLLEAMMQVCQIQAKRMSIQLDSHFGEKMKIDEYPMSTGKALL